MICRTCGSAGGCACLNAMDDPPKYLVAQDMLRGYELLLIDSIRYDMNRQLYGNDPNAKKTWRYYLRRAFPWRIRIERR